MNASGNDVHVRKIKLNKFGFKFIHQQFIISPSKSNLHQDALNIQPFKPKQICCVAAEALNN